jgi:hypothetical protein
MGGRLGGKWVELAGAGNNGGGVGGTADESSAGMGGAAAPLFEGTASDDGGFVGVGDWRGV